MELVGQIFYITLYLIGAGLVLVGRALKGAVSFAVRMLKSGDTGLLASPVTRLQTEQATPEPNGPDVARQGPNEQAWQCLADYHLNVQFSESFTASVSIFKSQQLARRRIRAISEPASDLMKQIYLRDAFDLPDVKLVNGVTPEDVILDTEAVGIVFISDLLRKKDPQYYALSGDELVPNCAQPIEVKKSDGVTVKVLPPDQSPEQKTARNLALLQGAMQSATSAPTPESMPGIKTTVTTKREAKGTTIGMVENFGVRDIPGTNGGAGYSTFEATILGDDGFHASLRGVQLNELFEENKVNPGDRVEITSLGRTRVAGEGGDRPTFRNEYKLRVLEKV